MTDVFIAQFKLHDLIHWLEIAELRWGSNVTARRDGSALVIYQDGKYRAAINLDDERPCLSEWADDDA